MKLILLVATTFSPALGPTHPPIVTSSLHLASRLRMRGAIPYLPNTCWLTKHRAP
jgi:hypothetical protein